MKITKERLIEIIKEEIDLKRENEEDALREGVDDLTSSEEYKNADSRTKMSMLKREMENLTAALDTGDHRSGGVDLRSVLNDEFKKLAAAYNSLGKAPAADANRRTALARAKTADADRTKKALKRFQTFRSKNPKAAYEFSKMLQKTWQRKIDTFLSSPEGIKKLTDAIKKASESWWGKGEDWQRRKTCSHVSKKGSIWFRR